MSGKQAKLQRRAEKLSETRDWTGLDVLMLRDDAEWLNSLAHGSGTDPNWEAITGLALTPHMARIVHEGTALVRSKRPTQLKAVELKFVTEIAAARHTVKLLDDNKKLYDGVIQDFDRINEEHTDVWALGENLALGVLDGRLFTTSRVASFQQSAHLAAPVQLGKSGYSYRLGFDIGRALPTILKQFGHGMQIIPTPLSLDACGQAPRVITLDRKEYYAERFEPELPLALKDVLTVIEGSVNSGLFLFKPSEGPFTGPVFRVLFVTLAHSLNALEEIRGKYADLCKRPGMASVIDVIDSPEALRLRSLRDLRNRCMHYGIPAKLTNLGKDLPVYGLVEATSPGLTFETVESYLLDTLASLSDALQDWRP